MKFYAVIIFLFMISTIFSQPLQPVRMVAEWEPAVGSLIRWPLGIPQDLVYELAVDDSLFVLVANISQQNSATNTFNSWNINMEHVVFIQAPTNSHWTRDWGPVSIFDGEGVWGIVDFNFEGYPWVPAKRERFWEHDNSVNSVLADFFETPLYQMPLFFTGGNVMTDGYGSAFSTRQMIDENYPIATPDQFFSIVESYTGVDNYQIISNFESYGIQHIDCVAKLLDEETVLIKRLPIGHPDYNRVETIVSEFSSMENCFGRPFKIVRIDSGSYSGNNTAAYTNSFILNNKVLVPLFGIDTDAEALIVYEEAMPGYEVIGFPWGSWYSYDALHCRVMGIFDRYMLRITHQPFDNEIYDDEDLIINAEIKAHSNQLLIDEEVRVFWKTEYSDWQSILMNPMGDDFYNATIPKQEAETEVSYYIQAADESGRVVFLPRTAPIASYKFIIISGTSIESNIHKPALLNFRFYPNPFNSETTIELEVKKNGQTIIDIFNIKGQRVAILHKGYLDQGLHLFSWNGAEQSSGIYLIKVAVDDYKVTEKVLLLK